MIEIHNVDCLVNILVYMLVRLDLLPHQELVVPATILVAYNRSHSRK
jgi:hypothetical protein